MCGASFDFPVFGCLLIIVICQTLQYDIIHWCYNNYIMYGLIWIFDENFKSLRLLIFKLQQQNNSVWFWVKIHVFSEFYEIHWECTFIDHLLCLKIKTEVEDQSIFLLYILSSDKKNIYIWKQT